jgi:hypothetical protein
MYYHFFVNYFIKICYSKTHLILKYYFMNGLIISLNKQEYNTPRFLDYEVS